MREVEEHEGDKKEVVEHRRGYSLRHRVGAVVETDSVRAACADFEFVA